MRAGTAWARGVMGGLLQFAQEPQFLRAPMASSTSVQILA
jgi:hypothetical protein